MASRRSATSSRFAADVAGDVGERAPVAGEREPGVEPVDASSEVRNSPTGSGVWPMSKYCDTRPSRWSPEISSRRAGWCRHTCEGAWPGVKITSHGPRSVSTVTPGTSSRSGSIEPVMPVPDAAAGARPSAAAAPRARRSGGRPRAGGPAPASKSSAVRRGACRRGGSTAARPCARGSAPPGRSGPRARACTRSAARPRARRPACSSARSRCAIEPGSCIPVSTSTIPEPAASAHALQCGTPGQGSGSRSRQTPGITRSPRPTSRVRVGLRTERDGNVTAMGKRARRRGAAEALQAPESEYTSPGGDVLALRGAMTPGDAAAVRGGAGRLAAVAGGRVAALGRVPVRAPRRALGDRGHRPDHQAEGAARPLPVRDPGRAAAGSATCCASTWRSGSRTWKRRERAGPGRLRGAARPTTASTCSRASRCSCAPPRSPRRCCSRSSGRCSSARRGRCCAPSCPARTRASGRRRATCTSTASRPPTWPRWRRSTRASASRRRPTRARSRASTPARMTRAARARQPLRNAGLQKRWCLTLWPTAARRAAGGHGHGRVRRLRARRAVPRPRRPSRRLGRAARLPGAR